MFDYIYQGNESCHVVLRGGAKGPNYSAEHVQSAVQKLEASKLPARIMIDCSHGNSQKVFGRQVDVVKDIVSLTLKFETKYLRKDNQIIFIFKVEQLKSSPTGQNIIGVMIESHLKEGKPTRIFI